MFHINQFISLSSIFYFNNYFTLKVSINNKSNKYSKYIKYIILHILKQQTMISIVILTNIPTISISKKNLIKIKSINWPKDPLIYCILLISIIEGINSNRLSIIIGNLSMRITMQCLNLFKNYSFIKFNQHIMALIIIFQHFKMLLSITTKLILHLTSICFQS